MTTTQICGVCERKIKDGYLCHGCTRQLRDNIRATPAWADQLDLVRARLVRYIEPTGRNPERPLPYNPAATEPLRRLDRAVRDCAWSMDAPAHIRTHRLGVVAAWTADHVTELRLRPDAPDHALRITRAIEKAEEISDRPTEHWYAGTCPCGKDLYPLVTEALVKCPECAHTWDVETRRSELLRKVRRVVAPGPDIARALSTFTDDPITPERIRKWRHKGWLKVMRLDPGPPPTNWYRVGDVLDLIAKETARKNARKTHSETHSERTNR